MKFRVIQVIQHGNQDSDVPREKRHVYRIETEEFLTLDEANALANKLNNKGEK